MERSLLCHRDRHSKELLCDEMPGWWRAGILLDKKRG
jgi:hypothetical protein